MTMVSVGLFAFSARAIVGGTEGPGALSISSAVVRIDHAGHRRVLRDFFAHKPSVSRLAARGSLPDGLITQLRAEGGVPPRLQEHLIPVPADLDSRLPPIPPYFSRSFAGRDLIVVDTRTDRIVSVLQDIRP